LEKASNTASALGSPRERRAASMERRWLKPAIEVGRAFSGGPEDDGAAAAEEAAGGGAAAGSALGAGAAGSDFLQPASVTTARKDTVVNTVGNGAKRSRDRIGMLGPWRILYAWDARLDQRIFRTQVKANTSKVPRSAGRIGA
jgi:hypothetical protein